jgi:hypothetical protein
MRDILMRVQIKDVLFIIAFLLISLFVLLHGLLMLFWPKKHTALVDWLAHSHRWSKPNPDWKPGRQIEKRFAGLAIVVMAFLMLWFPLSWFLHRTPLVWLKAQHLPRHGVQWFELLVAATIAIFGLYLFLIPEAYARWMTKMNPQRLYPTDFAERNKWVLRIFGLIIMTFAACILYLQFSS